MLILFEDNHLIAVNKRPSEIVQGDKTGDVPLSETVKEYIRVKYNKPGEAFIGVIHRIDRPVSGVVIFARTSKALARMNELFRSKSATAGSEEEESGPGLQKSYWAVVKNKPSAESGRLVHYLKKNEKQNKSYASDKPSEGALKAELDYRILSSSDNYHLLEIHLLTGRHHQIRAQLSAIGCPIKGDLKYGFKRTNEDASIHLHARSIAFIHPVTQQPVSITAEPPDEVLWNYFRERAGKR